MARGGYDDNAYRALRRVTRHVGVKAMWCACEPEAVAANDNGVKSFTRPHVVLAPVRNGR